jgi:hypothetical protein
MNLRHIWGDATCSDLVSDTPTHNAANYGVPAYPHYSTCSGNPVEMTMNYMDYTDDRGMFMFSNGQKIKNGSYFSFRWSESIIRNIIFLIKYIRKTRYLLASFFLCYMRSIKSKCIINYIFCIRQMRLQITFPPNDCNLVHLSQYKFLVVW